MINVLHITNTNFFEDSRIQKEIDVLTSIPNLHISIIGFDNHIKSSGFCSFNFDYYPLDLFFNKLPNLPKAFTFPFLMLEFFLVSFYQSFKIKPNVIHCHDTFSLPISWFISLIFRCKLIYDAHELESNKNGQGLLFSKITFLIEKLFWYRIDGFITVSNSILNWYIKKFSYKKSCILYNSPHIGKSNLVYKEKYFHEKYDLKNSDIVFCYLGLFSFGRGIDVLLEFFSKTNFNFHIVFIGNGQLDDKILEFSKKYPNIHLHPAVRHDKVVNLVKSADWGLCLLENVSLSDFYSLPNKVFEYAFSNIKIISSNFPEIEFFVKEYNLGYTCNPDINSFSRIMGFIKNNNLQLEKKSIYDYSWDYQEIKLKEFYLNYL